MKILKCMKQKMHGCQIYYQIFLFVLNVISFFHFKMEIELPIPKSNERRLLVQQCIM